MNQTKKKKNGANRPCSCYDILKCATKERIQAFDRTIIVLRDENRRSQRHNKAITPARRHVRVTTSYDTAALFLSSLSDPLQLRYSILLTGTSKR